jgi:hypothetical protein
MRTQRTHWKVGDVALARNGSAVKILRMWTEEGMWVAEVRYLDGHMPYPDVRGRMGGTEESPTWEHRCHDGKVVRSGGDYWNSADWEVERGLRRIDVEGLAAESRVSVETVQQWLETGWSPDAE